MNEVATGSTSRSRTCPTASRSSPSRGRAPPRSSRGLVPDAALDLGYYRFTGVQLWGTPMRALAHRLHRRGRLRALLRRRRTPTASGTSLFKAGAKVNLSSRSASARATRCGSRWATASTATTSTDTTHPLEAGLGVDGEAGQARLHGQGGDAGARRRRASTRRLVGFRSRRRACRATAGGPRADGAVVGHVTSGTFVADAGRASAWPTCPRPASPRARQLRRARRRPPSCPRRCVSAAVLHRGVAPLRRAPRHPREDLG